MSDDMTVAGLPVPAKEKVMRWLSHGAIVGIAVVGVLTFMPYINRALNLLLTGFFTAVQLGLLAVGTVMAAYAVMELWPVYKRLMESLANRATWALFEYDPVTPMEMWLDEVHADRLNLEAQYGQVCSVMAQNDQAVQDNLKAADAGQRLFDETARRFGRDSSEAHIASIKPGSLRASAERIKATTEPLIAIRDMLSQVLDTTKFTEAQAQADVDNFKIEWRTAQSVQSATASATRALRTKSQRKSDAMKSMKIIHDKYAGNFGRLQALRDLSRDVITSVSVTEGTYHQDALDRLRAESRLITGTDAAPALVGTVADAPKGLSFYNAPKIGQK